MAYLAKRDGLMIGPLSQSVNTPRRQYWAVFSWPAVIPTDGIESVPQEFGPFWMYGVRRLDAALVSWIRASGCVAQRLTHPNIQSGVGPPHSIHPKPLH
jgi:hypothetical protein